MAIETDKHIKHPKIKNYELIQLFIDYHKLMDDLENLIDSDKQEIIRQSNIIKYKIVKMHLYLIDRIMLRFKKNKQFHFFEIDDLSTYAKFGLIRAVELYDPTKKTAFTTFAVIKMNGAIGDYKRTEGPILRTDMDIRNDIDKFSTEFAKDNERLPTMLEIQTKFSVEKYRKAMITKVESVDSNTFHERISTFNNKDILFNNQQEKYESMLELYNLTTKNDKKREKLIFILLYFYNFSNNDISSIFFTSEALISQKKRSSDLIMHKIKTETNKFTF